MHTDPNTVILTAQRLERAADIVEERWRRGSVGVRGGSVCALGAIREACTPSRHAASLPPVNINPKAIAALMKAFPAEPQHRRGNGNWEDNVASYNDRAADASAVARRLRKAAKIIREGGSK